MVSSTCPQIELGVDEAGGLKPPTEISKRSQEMHAFSFQRPRAREVQGRLAESPNSCLTHQALESLNQASPAPQSRPWTVSTFCGAVEHCVCFLPPLALHQGDPGMVASASIRGCLATAGSQKRRNFGAPITAPAGTGGGSSHALEE